LLVSLLESHEAAELGLSDEAQLATAADLEFVSFAIPDRGVPTNQSAAAGLIEELSKALEAGTSVAIHCRQSVGRAGMLAAALLIRAGVPPSVAIADVSQVRGVTVPETPDQLNWLLSRRAGIPVAAA
jgi:protein-tyrosine phosphatase